MERGKGLLRWMKTTILLILILSIQLNSVAQEIIIQSGFKNRKEIKRKLLAVENDEITSKVRTYNALKGIGFVSSATSVIFFMSGYIDSKSDSPSYSLVRYGWGIITGFVGITTLLGSEIVFKKAINRYNEIVIAPTSNGVGLVYRF